MPNIGVFFRHKNSIDVFIEDNYDEEFYKALLNRVLQNNGHTLNKLLPLGCKKNVTDACRADQGEREQKRIYIVDADLELITNDNVKDLKHYYVHSKYCVENYLFDKNSIIEILHDLTLIDKDKIEKQLGYENWLKGMSKPLIELFIHYAICKKVCPTIQTVAFGVGKLCSEFKKTTVLDEVKINSRIVDLKTEIFSVISEEQYNDLVYDLRVKWPISVNNLLKIVSGKDYLLPLLEFRFQKFKKESSFSIKRETLRLRLAKLSDITELSDLKNYK